MRKFLAVLVAIGFLVGSATMVAQQQSGCENTPAANKKGGKKARKKPPITRLVMECYPDDFQAALEGRERFLKGLKATSEKTGREYVITRAKLWPQNSTLRVAFLGGTSAFHKEIALTAEEWTKHCNLKLDFGFNTRTGEYRKWTETDKVYAAEIRISFDQDGFWSLVGTDCIDAALGNVSGKIGGRPYQRTMNFGKFAETPVDYRKRTILHEFGHALGFQHEHQHPTKVCQADFRWDDDPGYVPTKDRFGQYIQDTAGRRPGIYTWFSGPPNNWSKARVDFNMKELPAKDSHAYVLGDFDKDSIMKYWYPAWMFVHGTQSPCFNASWSSKLSPKDIEGVGKVYPKNAAAARKISKMQKLFLKQLIKVKTLPKDAKKHYENQLERIEDR
jgi:hypothetical protein